MGLVTVISRPASANRVMSNVRVVSNQDDNN